jgi:serine/threonine protein kinase
VYSATDTRTGEEVAIKCISNVFRNKDDAIRILRELKVCRILRSHTDIVGVRTVCMPADPAAFDDIYIVMERMDCDLSAVIAHNDDLTDCHHKVFLYQILRGLFHMHHNKGILHRDLKPRNILVNSDCKVKLCDFGLSRPLIATETAVEWTDYVATRWYRAPELLGSFYGHYTHAVDVWSVGCIFAELLLRRPVLPGRDTVTQLSLITKLLGKPPQHVILGIRNPRARAFLEKMAAPLKPTFDDVFANAPADARDLLRGLLTFDPADRLTVDEALAHPYFASLPDGRNFTGPELVNADSAFAFEDEPILSIADVRRLMVEEIAAFHGADAASPAAPGRLHPPLYFHGDDKGREDAPARQATDEACPVRTPSLVGRKAAAGTDTASPVAMSPPGIITLFS